MKLQLALDDITLDDAVELLDKVHTYVDIIEVGSPFIIEEGMRPVRIFKEKYPDCEIISTIVCFPYSFAAFTHPSIVNVSVTPSTVQ